jgi:hypothetical protein
MSEAAALMAGFTDNKISGMEGKFGIYLNNLEDYKNHVNALE